MSGGKMEQLKVLILCTIATTAILAFVPNATAAELNLGDDCNTASEECPDDAVCYAPLGCGDTGTCKCQDGYQNKNDTCGPVTKLGEACEDDGDCGDNAECTGSSKMCTCEVDAIKDGDYNCQKCPSEYIEDGVSCVRDSSFGQNGTACNDTSDCTQNLVCLNDECQCDSNGPRNVYIDAYAYQKCLDPGADIEVAEGETCNTATDSSGKYCTEGYSCSTCPDGTMRCNKPEDNGNAGLVVNAGLSALVILLGLLIQ